jgi:hypothetical protein
METLPRVQTGKSVQKTGRQPEWGYAKLRQAAAVGVAVVGVAAPAAEAGVDAPPARPPPPAPLPEVPALATRSWVSNGTMDATPSKPPACSSPPVWGEGGRGGAVSRIVMGTELVRWRPCRREVGAIENLHQATMQHTAILQGERVASAERASINHATHCKGIS